MNDYISLLLNLKSRKDFLVREMINEYQKDNKKNKVEEKMFKILFKKLDVKKKID
tara:strand:+ start:4611 stop:4775 length:165 start_codon:yes stop_codon:yes gene_type:complete